MYEVTPRKEEVQVSGNFRERDTVGDDVVVEFAATFLRIAPSTANVVSPVVDTKFVAICCYQQYRSCISIGIEIKGKRKKEEEKEGRANLISSARRRYRRAMLKMNSITTIRRKRSSTTTVTTT